MTAIPPMIATVCAVVGIDDSSSFKFKSYP